MRTRRIGRNELAAIEIMRAYVERSGNMPGRTATATASASLPKRF